MAVCNASALAWTRSYWRLHGLAISNAIARLLLLINEPNKVDSERTKKDEEIGPIPSLLAEFV
jgi:hypothetical protein